MIRPSVALSGRLCVPGPWVHLAIRARNASRLLSDDGYGRWAIQALGNHDALLMSDELREQHALQNEQHSWPVFRVEYTVMSQPRGCPACTASHADSCSLWSASRVQIDWCRPQNTQSLCNVHVTIDWLRLAGAHLQISFVSFTPH